MFEVMHSLFSGGRSTDQPRSDLKLHPYVRNFEPTNYQPEASALDPSTALILNFLGSLLSGKI